MISFNKRRNTLEQETYHYELQDVSEPNLFRDIFAYHQPPKIPFNHRHWCQWIRRTRSGSRTRRSATGSSRARPSRCKQIVDLYTLLHRLSGPNGVIRPSEFFLYSDEP